MAGNFLNFKNGIWEVANRRELLVHFAPKIFDETLNRLHDSAVKVFTEIDPALDLEPGNRFAANIYGKVPKYSPHLKNGLVNALAFLATHPEKFVNCTDGIVERVVNSVVRQVFADASWKTWASLNEYLPLLAEVSPNEFMTAVENEFNNNSGAAFKSLLAQEGDGFTGGNYLTGLLWGLETIAWNENGVIRSAMCLAELASIDRGGNWANRPINSLTTIFLPWYPQTQAPIEKCVVAVKTIASEIGSVGWKLTKSLLPNQTQSSSGTRKPKWRQWISEGWEDRKVSRKDFFEQVNEYSKLLVEMVTADSSKIDDLVYMIPCLTVQPRERFAKYLESETVMTLPEAERTEIWESLLRLVNSHQRHSDTDWAMKPDLLERFAEIAKKLSPNDSLLSFQRLFQEDEFDLYEDDDDWQKQGQTLQNKRQAAVREIFENHGLDAILEFNQQVESHWHVGFYLAKIADESIDSQLLPQMLSEDKGTPILQFLHGYIDCRFEENNWNWVDRLAISSWDLEPEALFLRLLPFYQTWQRVNDMLGNNEFLYWEKVNFNPYQKTEYFEVLARKLLEHGRAKSAAVVLRSRLNDSDTTIDEELVVTVLMRIVEGKEPFVRNDAYTYTKLIQYLQDSQETNQEQLMSVEWAYLGILNKYHGAQPKLLRERLATDPGFFCEVIRFMYRSRTKPEPEEDDAIMENKKVIAENLYRLLLDWDRVPGLKDDESFEPNVFEDWLVEVEKQCAESGHLGVAHSHIGKVLVSSPPDPDGLVIHRTIATALNRKEADTLRDGYEIGIHNSRGAHWVDPSGKAELELAEKYEKQAADVENAGFFRLAESLRNVANSHKREAKRIVEEHTREVAEDENTSPDVE